MLIDVVHTTLEKLKNAALLLRLGLPSTLIHHGNRGFRKRSSNRRNLETTALSFRVDDGVTIIRWFPVPAWVVVVVFFNHKSKMTGDWLQFLWRFVDRAISLWGCISPAVSFLALLRGWKSLSEYTFMLIMVIENRVIMFPDVLWRRSHG